MASALLAHLPFGKAVYVMLGPATAPYGDGCALNALIIMRDSVYSEAWLIEDQHMLSQKGFTDSDVRSHRQSLRLLREKSVELLQLIKIRVKTRMFFKANAFAVKSVEACNKSAGQAEA